MSPSEQWGWLANHGEPVQVLRQGELWGQAIVELLVPSTQHQLRVRLEALQELARRRWSEAELQWRAAATRALAWSGTGEPLVAARGGVELLPHQLQTLRRAMDLEVIRLAICDEVGLGKTITAGAIFSELKARGQVQRVVVVAPKGVQLQWIAEMSERFGEDFVRIGPEGLPVDSGVNPWRAFSQVVCSLDAVKPLRRRAGWSAEQVEAYNAARYRALLEAQWDLVIIDEAHHVAGSTEEVARHELAVGLARQARHVLLLSATPHSGKSDGFCRLLGLLDQSLLHGPALTRESVAPYIARTEKRRAVDFRGQPLFQPRQTALRVAPYTDRLLEKELYEAVTEYVRHGWDAAKRQGRQAAAFVVLLMQRLVSSSTAAILAALEKRSASLGEPGAQLQLFIDRGEDWAELTGEEQFDYLVSAKGPAWATERAELSQLLQLARKAAAAGADAKVRAFFELLADLRRSERDPQVKVLVFTEFVPTQEMLLTLLEAAGVKAVAINGSLGLAERALAQAAFKTTAQVLVSTDAGGEGINLQFAHIVVNWDLPWSPTKLEQRIGRVDRIGQAHPVQAFNLVCEHSIEARVLEVLENKLAVILDELGADKRGDVLESASQRSEDLWTSAILDPAQLHQQAEQFAQATRQEAREAGHWVELLAETSSSPVISHAQELTSLVQLAAAARAELGRPVGDPLAALKQLPEVAPGEPCPVVAAPGCPSGWLSVWEVTPDGLTRSAIGVYQPDQGLVRPDLALKAWDRCCNKPPILDQETPSPALWERLYSTGIDHAYQAVTLLAKGSDLRLPNARLRLLVRIRS